MPINVFGNSCSLHDNGNKIDKSLFLQKPYLRSNSIEGNIEEDIDLRGQYRIKRLPVPKSIREACIKKYVDNMIIKQYYSIIKNIAHFNLNEKKLTDARLIQIIRLPQSDSHLTAQLYADIAIDEPSLVRNNQDNDFNYYNLTKIKSITLNTQAVKGDQVISKAYVDQFHQEDEQSRRDLGKDIYDESNDLVKNNQDNDFNGNKQTNIVSMTINRDPTSDNKVANKKFVDDSVGDGSVLRFNQTLENKLKVSVGNDTYNLTKDDKNQIIDTTIIKSGDSGGYLSPYWKNICND